MTVTNSNQNNLNLFSRFKRGQAWKEYAGYHVGDILESQPIAIPAGSTVVGNIVAPQIMILGLLSGSAIGRDVVVSSGGAVWGDVYAAHFQLESGGKLRGWLTSITDAELKEFLAKNTTVPPLLENGDSPSTLKPEHKKILDRDRLDALHQLQMETAVALAARTELEESFDQRLSEMAGETNNQLTLIREELKTTQTLLDAIQKEADETKETLQTRNSQFKRQSEELASTQDLLAQTTIALEKLQLSHAEKEESLAEIQSAKAGVDTHLEEALIQVDTLTGRVHNIETALQASLVHTSDQEDALLRWQEFAETNEQKVTELQYELNKANRQIQENNDVIAMLRDQRKQLEKEWGEAQTRVDELEQQLENSLSAQSLLAKSDETIQTLVSQQSDLKTNAETIEKELTEKLEQLTQQLSLKEEEVLDARLHYKKLHARWKKANADIEAIQQQPTKLLSSNQLNDLSNRLLQSEERAEQLQEQLLWNQASLETAQRELTQIRAALAARDQEIQALQKENFNHQEQFAKQKEEIKKIQETLQNQKKQASQDQKELNHALKIQRSQLDASEKELAHYLNETASQGDRLAEIQATLVERDIQLQEAKQIIEKQQKFIKQMQQVTKKRLQELQEQLAASQKS
ncbi:MAG: polymer-forming cytoskeletal protein [Anaerolineae bacterium]|nr:polymer-forming cytoskeletal protein [Anaerolineae bacterium]